MIHKHYLTRRTNITVSIGAKFLDVQMQGDQVALWVDTNPDAAQHVVTVVAYATGSAPYSTDVYIATVQVTPTYVLHFYYS